MKETKEIKSMNREISAEKEEVEKMISELSEREEYACTGDACAGNACGIN